MNWLSLARPKVFWVGQVPSGTGFLSGPGPVGGTSWLILGIDLYAGEQPNNGDMQISQQVSGGANTIFLVQQSQNFPGPFMWRGLYPFIGTGTTSPLDLLEASGSVPFGFSVWGLSLPTFDADQPL